MVNSTPATQHSRWNAQHRAECPWCAEGYRDWYYSEGAELNAEAREEEYGYDEREDEE